MHAQLRMACPPVGRPPSQVLSGSHKFLLLHCLLQSCALSNVLLHRKKVPLLSQIKSLPLRVFPSAKSTTSLAKRQIPANSDNSSCPAPPGRAIQIRIVALALLFGGPLSALKSLLSALPPDFSQRWRVFFEEYGQNGPGASCRTEHKSCILYDRHGEVITTVDFTSRVSLPSSNDPNTPNSAIPTFLWQAVVACEDRRFFRHPGIDPRGLARAGLSFSRNGGGSTITQQLVKNVFLTNERKWTRKLMEMILALILESRMSKWDILQAYLKKIYWGHGNYGVDAAANFYFGKSIFHLNIGECAMLAGMIPAPEVFSPFQDPSRGKRAKERALCRMVEVGFLDSNYAAATLSEPLELTRGGEVRKFSPCKAPFFVDEVLKALVKRYGYRRISEGGLKIYTTLDLGMQELAERVINERLTKLDAQQVCSTQLAITQMQKELEELQIADNSVFKAITKKGFSKGILNHIDGMNLAEETVSQSGNFSSREEALQSSIETLQEELKVAVRARLEAALVLINHSDGGVIALIGGREQVQSDLNWSSEVNRPLGSALKPVIYLAALTESLSIRDLLKNDAGQLEAKFYKESLAKKIICLPKESCESLATKSVVDKVSEMGKRLAIETPSTDPNLTLEGFKQTTPMQLANVFSTIGSGGIFHKPFFITRVETAEGIILEENKVSGIRVVEGRAIRQLNKLLQFQQQGRDQKARTKHSSRVRQIVVSDGCRDAWCAGFTRDLTCVVWLGYDDFSCTGLHLRPGSGSSQATEIWKDSVAFMHKDRAATKVKGWRLHSVRKARGSFKVRRH